MSDRDAFAKMDRMYRLQRYFYDITRKYYLLGRDRLLREMDLHPGDTVLEVGCGTARNLIILSRMCPEARLFGLDASAAMLETAEAKIAAAKAGSITLQTALADTFDHEEAFGLAEPFDTIYFSYSISMIPTWRESLENALRNLKPGGRLFIVDFYDQRELPSPFRRLLKWWLSKFDVKFWPELIPFLGSQAEARGLRLEIEPLYRRYSFIAAISKAAAE